MYFWRNYRRRRYRPRTRRYWRRRSYRPFQRRFWRRRHRRVRKRKLKSIRLKEWQPHFIRKLTVKGYYPLFLSTSDRLTNNANCYLESVAPHNYPGGGGFQILNFTLDSLYKEHLVLKNWWTQSNDNLPLIRYCGCTITLYRQEYVDYLFYYNNSQPMIASKLSYMSTHPAAMLLNKHTRKILCKSNNRNKKPYTKLHIKPPTQWQTKWYFQKDIAHQPLLQIMVTAASLDRMFLHANAKSTTIGFTSVNTLQYMSHLFSKQTTTGYVAVHNQLMFAVDQAPAILQIDKIKFGQLIFLGNPDDKTEGTRIDQTPPTGATTGSPFQKKIQTHRLNSGYWGNPFHPHYFHGDIPVLTTSQTWEELKNTYSEDNYLNKQHWQLKQNKYIDCRYNPFKDKGIGNKVYLLSTTNLTHSDDWGPPEDEDLIWENLPLWILTWGYLDFQKKCGTLPTIDTKSVFVIYSPYIEPQGNKLFVPIDNDFLHGNSPYDPDHTIPSDYFGWHPKVRFQVQSINLIGTTGPGVAKLPENISCEAHCGYKFYFKVGGNPPPMSTLIDPDKQPKYNIPNNMLQTTSLQSPTTPFEFLLWNFDERRGTITKKAAERIKTYKETETSVFPITESSMQCPTTSNKTLQTPETSDTEEEETTTEALLLNERRKQKLLRKRINQLLHRLAILE
nr:MAG: ORF1 [TTV-like mini virus]